MTRAQKGKGQERKEKIKEAIKRERKNLRAGDSYGITPRTVGNKCYRGENFFFSSLQWASTGAKDRFDIDATIIATSAGWLTLIQDQSLQRDRRSEEFSGSEREKEKETRLKSKERARRTLLRKERRNPLWHRESL